MDLLHDARLGLRILVKRGGFSLVVIATLALGIGATSAMFSVVQAVILRPLDLPAIDRLAIVQERGPRDSRWDDEVSPAAYHELLEDTRSFEKLAGYQWWDASLTGDGEPEQVVSFLVSHGFFQMLGVKPLLGRAFSDDEVDGKTENVAILSHGLWTRRYGADPGVVGRRVEFNGKPFTIVGVMPPKVIFPLAAEMWAPLTFSAAEKSDRRSRYIGLIGRLKDGVSLAQADAELRGLGERYAAQHPDTDGEHRLRLVGAVAGVTGKLTRGFSLTLLGAALFVLLIAAANVANLFLAHALARRRELVVRTALGATRGRIVRQLLVESMLLGAAGGGASLLLAGWVVDLIKAGLSPRTTRFIAGWNEMGVDATVLALTLAAGVLVGLVFGVLPALQASRLDLAGALKDGEHGATIGLRGHRLRSTLVVAQVSLALALLVGAAALVDGFRRMADPRETIVTDRLLTLRLQLNPQRYPKRPDLLAYEQRALAALSALPGVEGAAIASAIPWGELHSGAAVEQEGAPPRRPGDELVLDLRSVTPGYLELLRTPLLEGRPLASGDGRDAPRVALLSARAAALLWPGESPLGRRLRVARGGDERPWITVVGVVSDIPHADDDRLEPRPTLYVPREQSPTRALYVVVRTGGDPAAQAGAVTAALHAVDPNQPLIDVKSLEDVRRDRLSGIRLGASMMAGLALLALLLAAIGIYGVATTLVVARTHEIGVRMALGARRRDVLRLVVGKGLGLTVVGLIVGLGLTLAVMRVLGSALSGLVVDDHARVAIVAGVVTAVSLLGAYLPARRAARVDPMIALRHD